MGSRSVNSSRFVRCTPLALVVAVLAALMIFLDRAGIMEWTQTIWPLGIGLVCGAVLRLLPKKWLARFNEYSPWYDDVRASEEDRQLAEDISRARNPKSENDIDAR